LSPDAVRGFLPGFAYQCSVLIAGTVGWAEAVMAQHMSYARAMAMLTLLIFSGAIIAVALGREKRGVIFGEE